MKILILCHAFNSLSQRMFVHLQDLGHDVSVEIDVNDKLTEEAVELFEPELIIAPFLKRAITEKIWKQFECMIVHPGIAGDRGPHALDHAILRGEKTWGVTVLRANRIWDGGDVWSSVEFELNTQLRKGEIYRHSLAAAAIKALDIALIKFVRGDHPTPQIRIESKGTWNDPLTPQGRTINWEHMTSAVVVNYANSADGQPGCSADINDNSYLVFNLHEELELDLTGTPGTIIAVYNKSICIACKQGAVWVSQLSEIKPKNRFLKRPATDVINLNGNTVNTIPTEDPKIKYSWQEVRVNHVADTAYIRFDFYNGAMNTQQCQQLKNTIELVKRSDAKTVVLLGGDDFWSNGLHLASIEASERPAEESWENINAMNDLVHCIITLTDKLVVAVLRGNAGAGGVFMALAADKIVAYDNVVLNPHYKSMGNLYGSEYWTYLLPKRVTEQQAQEIMHQRLPISAVKAYKLGLVDTITLEENITDVEQSVHAYMDELNVNELIENKKIKRELDETVKPLEQYRQEELENMKLNFYGFDPSYHVARYHFIYKTPKSRTPVYLATHRKLKL